MRSVKASSGFSLGPSPVRKPDIDLEVASIRGFSTRTQFARSPGRSLCTCVSRQRAPGEPRLSEPKHGALGFRLECLCSRCDKQESKADQRP